MTTSAVSAIITDLDNTLYDWVAFVVPALEAMVESLAATSGRTREEIVAALKLAYSEEETAEYAFVLQRSGLYEQSGMRFEEFLSRVIEPARKTFAAERTRHLKLYPGVAETLAAMKARGLKIIGLTDAPAFPAQARLKKLGLDGCFDALYALENYLPPTDAEGRFLLDPEILARQRRGEYDAAFGKPVELAKEHEKPSPLGIRKILFDFGLKPDETVMVGDNPAKDLAAAAAAGVRSLHAAYGAAHDPALIARLHALTPGRLNARHRAAGAVPAAAAAPALREFGEILNHL
jgi:phosphoglycolate phosphatase